MNVADADIALHRAVEDQILREGARRELAGEFGMVRAPGGIVPEGIGVDRHVRAAMHAAVRLLVAGDAELRDLGGPRKRALDEGRGLALGAKRADPADVNGNQMRLGKGWLR